MDLGALVDPALLPFEPGLDVAPSEYAVALLGATPNKPGALKALVRRGCPTPPLRAKTWSVMLGLDRTPAHERDFAAALTRAHGPNVPVSPAPPLFGGYLPRTSLPMLTAAGWTAVDHVLCCLQHDLPTLHFFPAAAPLAAILLTHLDPGDVLWVTETLGRNYLCGRALREGLRCLPVSTRDAAAVGRAFSKLMLAQLPAIHTHLAAMDPRRESPALPRELEKLFGGWISGFFLGVLPAASVLRIADAWTIEGDKILLRYALAVVSCARERILACTTPAEVTRLFSPRSPDAVWRCPPAVLAQRAFGFSFSRDDLPPLPSISVSTQNLEDAGPARRLQPKLRSPSIPGSGATPSTAAPPAADVIKEDAWVFLWSWIPEALNSRPLELVFKAGEHGFRLGTLYDRVAERSPLLLVVRTGSSVFGAFISCSLDPVPDNKARYGGTGETFVFTLEPAAKMWAWVGLHVGEAVDPKYAAEAVARAGRELGSVESVLRGSANENALRGIGEDTEAPAVLTADERSLLTELAPAPSEPTSSASAAPGSAMPSPIFLGRRFSATPESASLFVLATKTSLCIGGGGSRAALTLDVDLEGSTGPCHTFANTPLDGSQGIGGMFVADEVEVFAFAD
ncbi:hypothetical protein DFJ74DRAFT_656221 [Hyaloraphidium curvatum]|nr:hypothetical protein DFJ74DRAFT_656221 [Hyaloraphidium curvatum]